MKIFKYLLIVLIVIVAAFGLFLLYAVIDNYNPDEQVVIEGNTESAVLPVDTVSIMLWNIGYCGMDESIDFFYDGGTQSRVSKERTIKNIEDIETFIEQKKNVLDFILLQEVDVKAKRSYKIDQLQKLTENLNDFSGYYGKNYDVFFIPIPVSKPYGTVNAGIVNFLKYKPAKVTRFQYPGNYSFPTNLFMLDRCFLETRYKLKNGKELLVINLHNSAFDDGSLRAQQLDFLKKYLVSEYQDKGNYIIVGGDWNQSPAGFKPEYLSEFVDDTVTNSFIPDNYLPSGWNFVYDPKVPTNRRSNIVYDKATTPTTLIDFFLISPNIETIDVKGIDLNFVNSDHNPVEAKFVLK